MEKKEFTLEINNKKITVELNNLAQLSNGSALVRMGDTVVMANAVMGTQDRYDLDFFPLLVDYEEKFYAAGKIFGSRFLRREARPSETAILVARLIDRTIRPLFSPLMRRDVQVVVTCLSIDEENDPDILGIIAASVALGVSDIPFDGPVSALRIGWSQDKGFIINPTYSERQELALDLTVSGPNNQINMIEAGASEVPEEIIKEALKIAQEQIALLNQQQEQIIKENGKPKATVLLKTIDSNFEKDVREFLKDKLERIVYGPENKQDKLILNLKLKEELINYLKEKQYSEEYFKDIQFIIDDEIDKLVHRNIIEYEKRPDGRTPKEIRSIETYIDLLPRAHGSALFMRGLTHVLSVVTLGSPADTLMLQGIEFVGEKRFMHHYNFPGYSSGEVSPLRGPGRREIGHGALAEKALMAVIPSKDEFPYTIRVVSEVMSSNGSTSMASTCASSMALMASGVPIKEQVAGIAMGLMSDNEGRYKILTDIQGPEDHYGDMDFKVAGTKNGITALQMDIKIKGVDAKLLSEALDQAKEARMFILEKMNQTISSPRQELSPFAPRIYTIKIKPEKIGELIGPGGKIIQGIIQRTETEISVEEDGTVYITAEKKENAEKALQEIKELMKEYTEGEIVNGKVVQIKDFGAIIDLGSHKEGLLHISELAPYRVNRVEDIVHEGEELKLKIKKIEPNGKISLSLKDVTHPNEQQDKYQPKNFPPRRPKRK